MSRKRLQPDDRKYQILTAALELATTPGGYKRLTRKAIADRVGCAEGLVSRYFATMPQMRRTVMRSAVLTENLHIIAQGLADGDPHAAKAPADLKARAIATLSGV